MDTILPNRRAIAHFLLAQPVLPNPSRRKPRSAMVIISGALVMSPDSTAFPLGKESLARTVRVPRNQDRFTLVPSLTELNLAKPAPAWEMAFLGCNVPASGLSCSGARHRPGRPPVGFLLSRFASQHHHSSSSPFLESFVVYSPSSTYRPRGREPNSGRATTKLSLRKSPANPGLGLIYAAKGLFQTPSLPLISFKVSATVRRRRSSPLR